MEGVPRLPMLRTTLKTSPEKTDFNRKIKWQIREHFNEDPNSYANEVRELETLRAGACHPPQDFSGCSLLKKYFSQLHFLQNRFSFEETGRDEVYFTWNDMYTGMAYSTTDIKHEMACVLFNIGALHINLGAMDNRQTADGMKMSCSHFQCAAWAFQQLNEKYPQPRETDLCHEIVRFLGTISLAQAQECILEKSIVDGRKPGIVAKVAAQIVDYFKTALKVLEQGNNHTEGNAVIEVAGNKTYKSWKKYAEFKMTFHQSVALLYMGIHSEEMQKMGERLAYFQAAMEKLTEATKLAKKIDNQAESINDAVSFTHDVIGGKLKAAEKENEFVYHEKVPDRSSLPEIKGASLVKGTAFDIQDPEVSGQDIFHRLVPMEAHEASSLYSEEKAKLLRHIGGSVEEKDQELAVFLTSLQVDQLRLHMEPSGLPQELIDVCAAFSVESDVAQKLIEAMGQLSSVYTDVESSLSEIQQLLSEEQESERLFQSQNKRPPSMILKELSLEASRYADAHAKAADSNMLLHKAINSHLANLRTLSLPLNEIQAQLPSLQVLESSKDQAAIKELQRLLDKVEEMRKQRRMLYTQLREALQADDITKLATHQTDLGALFAQELAKHQRLTSLIEQNLSAQEKILVALTEANARYADTRRSTADIQQRRASAVANLLASAEAYPDLLGKCQKGIEFYKKMDTNATKLLQRLRSVCRVQEEEREQQEAATAKRPVARIETQSSFEQEEGPKLKDFLHLMKKDRLNPDQSADLPPYSEQYRQSPIGADQTYSYSSPSHVSYPTPASYSGYPGSQPAMPDPTYGYPSLQQHNYSAVSSLPCTASYSTPATYSAPTTQPFAPFMGQMPASSYQLPQNNPSSIGQVLPVSATPYASAPYTPATFQPSHSTAPYGGYQYSGGNQPPVGSQTSTIEAFGSHPYSATHYPTASSVNTTVNQPQTYPTASFTGQSAARSSQSSSVSSNGTVNQPQYQYYQGYNYPTTSNYQYQSYGYPAADGTGGYQHGSTGTTNTPSNHNVSGYTTPSDGTASGLGQYQQYPYYYPAGPYYPPAVMQPVPIAATPVAQATSNLELLTLLDVSVPISPASALLEPQEATPGGRTHGTVTLTNSTRPMAAELTATVSEVAIKPVYTSSSIELAIEPIKNGQAVVKDPLADAESAIKLASEVEKLDKLVDGLTRKSLNGPTPLDTRWKEVQELQERESSRRSISVARCYPMKNRLPDVLPYDHNRVELPTTKDDYINATNVSALSTNAPSFVATQTPLPCSLQDFWTMIWQQSVEIVVCLLSDAEMPKTSGTSALYWPVEKGQNVTCGPWTIALQSSNTRPYCNERILGLSKEGESKQRVLIHLQFTTWPGNSFPASPAQFLQLASEVFHFWQQQRNTSHPIVVHCLAGAGRTGLLCLLVTALADLASGHGLLDVVRVAGALCQQRRNMFRDREHLLFAYQALLYHAQDLLMKRGILSGTSSLQGSPCKKSHPSQDFIHSQNPTHSISPVSLPVVESKIEVAKDPVETPEPQIEEPSSLEPEPKKSNTGALAILDPANFNLEGSPSGRQRVTKESFASKNSSQLGAVKDPSDPLSQLDPLWSLAK